jgi:tetratricopeptide (TPR) repeat protein/transcriptional regulator with XRE-family HTH domain
METGPSLGFGTLLRRYRVAAGLSQEELAERARLSVRTVGDLERGVSHAPRKDTVALLAQALDLGAPERAALAEAARRLSTTASSPPTPAGTSSPPLIGRRRQLALLEHHLSGQGLPVLLLAGEPGIGKTRLLHAALPRAAGHGLRVLEGGCQRRSGHAPYAPLLDALQRHIRHQAPALLRTELAGCAWLVRLLPELAGGPIEPLPAWTLPPEQERRLMVQAVLRLLANVAGPAGTLLVLDDLQWASPDALELLTVLVRSASEVPLRVLGAYRHTEVGPQDPLSVMLADLAQAGLATQHTLPPLTREEAGQLLAALLADGAGPEPWLQRVLQRAGGVPFFLVSCAQALRTAEGAQRVPWDVAQGLRQRVAALPPAAQEVLKVAAVVGREVAPALLTVAAAQPEREVLAALDAAGRAGLLEEAGVEGYRFAHDVIREVVEADLGRARRTVLHRRIAEALEGLPGEPSVELLAYHYARSDAQDKAVLYLEQVGDHAAAQHAHAAAEGYYWDLVKRLVRLGRGQDAARGREKLGSVLRTAARYDEALAVLEQAGEAYRAAADREGARRTLAQIGQVHAVRGTAEDGVRRMRAVLETMDTPEPSPGLAALYAALAHLYFASGRIGEQLAAAERAAELARVVGDGRILADAETKRGLALFYLGRLEEAQRVLEEVIPLTEAVGHLDILRQVLTSMASVYGVRGELEQGRRCAERARAVAERRGDAAQVVFATVTLGVLSFQAGDWVQARVHLERALALAREIGAPRVVASALVELGWLCLAEGARDEATRYLEEGCAIADRGTNMTVPLQAHGLLAERQILEGRPEAACARLAPLRAGAGQNPWVGAHVQLTLAWAYLEMGHVAVADEMVGQAVARVRSQGHRLALVDALRVQAMVATRQGRWKDAERTLKEGLALARSMPYPYAEGRLLHVYGEMHAQKGEPEPARERLEAALAIFRRLGARKDAERAEEALTTLPQ